MEKMINRNYKDTLFRFIFREKAELLSLYNAVNGSSYDNPEELEVTTIEDVVYIHIKNDASFLIRNVMNLYEHQSTFNPNIPVRGLMYFADMYKAYMSSRHLAPYSSVQIKLPTPQYIVFYNGTRKEEDVRVLRLSDAFENAEGKKPCLECEAVQYNINAGHNEELLRSCRKLWEYSEFVERVRIFDDECHDIGKAVELAIDYCIEHNILKDIKHRAEVREMILFEYDEEAHINAFREEGRIEGIEKGRIEGRIEGIEKGREEGRIEGIEKGRAEGEVRFAELASKLLGDMRQEDLMRAINDKAYKESLYEEYGIA